MTDLSYKMSSGKLKNKYLKLFTCDMWYKINKDL